MMVLTISVTKMLAIVVSLSLSGLHVQAVSNHFLQPVKGKQKFVNTYFFFFFLNLYIQNEFSDPIILGK